MRFEIVNKSESEAEISIDGVIGWDDDASWVGIKKQLADLVNSKIKKITVNINSLGGYATDGLMIHDALSMFKGEITTRVFSLTASAATIIAQAGSKRQMSSNALYLIHHASNIAMGNVNDIRATVDDLEKVDARLFDIYIKRGGDEAKVRTLMAENNGYGKWIDAEEAKESGLIDEIIEPSKAVALAAGDIEAFKQFNLPKIQDKYMKDKKFFDKIVDFLKGEDETVVDEVSNVTAEVEDTAVEAVNTTAPEAVETAAVEAVEDVQEPEAVIPAEEPEAVATAEALRNELAAATEDVQRLTAELAEARTALAKATSPSTKPKGKAGGEDDDIENINIPFSEEIKALDGNFLLGKPLNNPKSK